MTATTSDIVIEQGSVWRYPVLYELGDPAMPVALVTEAWTVEAAFWDLNGVKLLLGVGTHLPQPTRISDAVYGTTLVDDAGHITFSITEPGTYRLSSSGGWRWRTWDAGGTARAVEMGALRLLKVPTQ